MKLTRTTNFHPAVFGIIPLINVLFLTLIFFTLSSTFVLQPGIAVTLPFSHFSAGLQRDPQIISITSGSAPAIYYRDQKMTLEELNKSLSESPVKERSLIIKADRKTPYDLIVQVTNIGLETGFSVVLAATEKIK